MATNAKGQKTRVSRDPCALIGAGVTDAVSGILGGWGSFVAQNPFLTFVTFLILVAALASGIRESTSETDAADLWTPEGAQALADRDLYETFFGSGFRTETIYVQAKKSGNNVISNQVLAAVVDIDSMIRNGFVSVTVNGSGFSYEDLCERNRPSEPCLERPNPVDYINVNTNTLIQPVPEAVQQNFANVKTANNGDIISASTIKLTYLLSRENDDNRDKDTNPTLQWEDELVAWLEKYDSENKDVRVFVQAQNSISNVLSGIIGGDIIALNVAFVLIILYAFLVLGKFHPVLSRVGVAFVGVCCVGSSIAATYGLCGYLGVPQTPVTTLLPFILAGIGVDDMFVLVGALDRAPLSLSIPVRVEFMMQEAGASITMTSLTDMLAFALGTLTAFPALRDFCVYAAIGIILNWLFFISLFVAAIALDERRRDARGVDCFWCAPCSQNDKRCAGCYVKEENMDKSCNNGKCCTKEGGYLRSYIRDSFAPALKSTGIKTLVLVITAVFFVVGVFGLLRLEEDFSPRFFVPSDDPLQEVFDIADTEFQSGETIVNILLDHRYVASQSAYLHSSSTQGELLRVTDAVEAFEWYEPNTLTSPLDKFEVSLGAAVYPVNTKEFYDALHKFLASDAGSSVAGMFAVYDWYSGFINWIIDNTEELDMTDPADTVAFGGSTWAPGDFDADTLRPISAGSFCTLLKAFLATSGGRDVAGSIVPAMDASSPTCYPPSGDVAMHRVSLATKCRLDEGDCPRSNATAAIETMDGIREAVADLESPLRPTAYSFEFLNTEQFKVVRREAAVNLGLALAAVGIVTLLLVGHIFAGILVVLNVLLVLIDITGLMWIWGVSINQVSIINLVLAIGLAVDYSAHIAFAFMRAVGTREERMVTALGEMGADVTHGALSTFVAVLVTGASQTYIFQTFFRQFFGICFFGIFHGIVVLPVVLSVIGPSSRELVQTPAPESKNDIEKQQSDDAEPKRKQAWAGEDERRPKPALSSVAASGAHFGSALAPSVPNSFAAAAPPAGSILVAAAGVKASSVKASRHQVLPVTD